MATWKDLEDGTYINLDAVEFIKWESNNTTTLHFLSGHSLNLNEVPFEVIEQALTGAQGQRLCSTVTFRQKPYQTRSGWQYQIGDQR